MKELTILNLEKNHYYAVEFNDALSSKDMNILIYFYKPLIGSDAFYLYLFLTNETLFINKEQKKLELNRIYQMLKIDIKKLFKLITILSDYHLLEFYYADEKLELNMNLFIIKKPLIILKFLATEFYTKLKKIIDNETLTQFYYYLKPKTFLPASKDVLLKEETKLVISDNDSTTEFLNKLDILEKNNYQIKLKDVGLIKHLKDDYKLNFNIIKLILEFTLFKIGNIQEKYILKIVQTLNDLNKLYDLEKVQVFFQEIYQKNKLDDLNDSKKYCPNWLKIFHYNKPNEIENKSKNQVDKLLKQF